MPLLRDCVQTFRFPAGPPSFTVANHLHVCVKSLDCSSDDSGARLGGGAGGFADCLDECWLDGADDF